MRKFSTGAARLANRRADECMPVVLIGEDDWHFNCRESISVFKARFLAWFYLSAGPADVVPGCTGGRPRVE